MSSILYYSNFCEPSKKLLQTVSKTQNSNNIHFVCIDRRINENGKLYIVLQNGQKLIMPENVTRVPALLLLNQNYRVIYGDEIYSHLKPQVAQEVKKATNNNMEPTNYQEGFNNFGTFSGFGGSVVSDNYSFLDQSDGDLSVKGNGGLRQIHNYVTLSESMGIKMNLPNDDVEYNKIKEGETSIEALKRKRDEDISNISCR